MLCDTDMGGAASRAKNSPADIQPYILRVHFVSQKGKNRTLYTCMWRQSVCGDTVYVATQCMWRHSVCGDTVYVATQCMWRYSVCGDTVYVATQCMWRHSTAFFGTLIGKSVASNNVLQLIASKFLCNTNTNDPVCYPDQQMRNIYLLIIFYVP